MPYEQAANFVLAPRRASRGAYGKWRFSGSALLQVRPGKLERFCNWSGDWRGVTRRVAFPAFFEVAATVCTGGTGRLAFFASVWSTYRYSASRLSASPRVWPRMEEASARPLLTSA